MVRRNNSTACEAGFSIIDAIIGTVLIGMVLVGFLTAFRQITMGTLSSTGRTYVAFLVQEKMEQLKEYDGGTVFLPVGPVESVKRGNITYQVQLSQPVSNELDSAGLNSRIQPYKIRVSWFENGQSKAIEAVCYIFIQ